MGSYPEERVKATKTHARAPGLDGVRALAVLAVMGFHAGVSELSGGFLGVDIFFVLSGFLITDLLVVQYDRLGRLDLKSFWARRARRLLPPLAVMLVVVTAAATVIEPSQESSLRLALLAAATYTSNWYQIAHHVSYFASLGPMPPLDHLWSLAIEEQFYLIWPLLLWFLILRLPTRRARIIATLLGAALSALAMALEYTPGGNPSAVYYGTYTHASALLIGSALALAYPLATLSSTSANLTRRLDAVGVAGLAVLAWAIGHFSGSDPAVYPFGLILAAVGAAGLVAAAASNGLISAMTSLRPLRWLGIRSYAMYLWHWPVIALTGAVAGQAASSPWLWVIEAALTIALAALSWQFIEGPILQNGFRVTCRHWIRLLTGADSKRARRRRDVMPTAVAASHAHRRRHRQLRHRPAAGAGGSRWPAAASRRGRTGRRCLAGNAAAAAYADGLAAHRIFHAHLRRVTSAAGHQPSQAGRSPRSATPSWSRRPPRCTRPCQASISTHRWVGRWRPGWQSYGAWPPGTGSAISSSSDSAPTATSPPRRCASCAVPSGPTAT